MAENKDYYSLLGIERDSTLAEIREAYFDAARQLHPDKNTAPGETEMFISIQEAYEVLSNPKKRSQYDATLPPEKHSLKPLEYRLLFSRPSLLPLKEPQLVYVLLELSYKIDSTQLASPPLNFCLVIDRSTSMRGKNMDKVKDTAIQIVHRLKSQDYFSLVAFSDRAEVIIPAENGADIRKLETRIQMITCGGGTEIYSGLELAFAEVNRNVRSSSSNHIILLTDGRTYGDEANCLDLARKAAEHKISIRGLGIGAEWNDSFLDELASLTGGSSMYISHSQDIQRILLEQIKNMTLNNAEDTRLEFSMPEGVELRYAFRIQPEPGLLPTNSPILFGPIHKGGILQVLMEIVVKSAKGADKITMLEGKIGLTLKEYSPKPISFPLKLRRIVQVEPGTEPPPVEIVSALSKLMLYRLQEQARLEVSAGEYDQAAEHLQQLSTHLLAQGERGLAKTALLEAENIRRQKDFSQEGQKAIKYGTRALLTSGERM